MEANLDTVGPRSVPGGEITLNLILSVSHLTPVGPMEEFSQCFSHGDSVKTHCHNTAVIQQIKRECFTRGLVTM